MISALFTAPMDHGSITQKSQTYFLAEYLEPEYACLFKINYPAASGRGINRKFS